ncbi:hypothetical protein HA151_07025 [Prochlorococcus marinus XMU1419]|uniref:hypothetical protein n=1 Tax=Prochlorococcus marinus TaxID=1219 RepID=UPI001ADD6192|nr:hypothetical protein [Prochlorococcus marinus]MBO8234267.1 hypothetical protein [Prochlorococcus marinus XMU1419]MBW3075957.1 hypothetical protein [Prochlorococcus marinus str. XMU1419]
MESKIQIFILLIKNLKILSKFQFNDKGFSVFSKIKFININDQNNISSKLKSAILIPLNPIKSKNQETISWQTNIDNVDLILWDKILKPKKWHSYPSNENPLFYFDTKRNLILPSWDIISSFQLFINSDNSNKNKDKLGRIISNKVEYHNLRLDNQPHLNNANFIFLKATLLINNFSEPVEKFISPIKLIISHDIDLLRSNDFLSQSIRSYRLLLAFIKFNFKDIKKYFSGFIRAIFFPYRNYGNSIFGMIDIERQFDYKSSFYFLFGKRGRYGPRSSERETLNFARSIPEGWSIGLHYNFDSFKNDKSLKNQLLVLRRNLKKKVISGRAHYFIFDFHKDAKLLNDCGIKIDESLSWHDSLGFRFGIAGPLIHQSQNIKTLFIPTIFMDQLFWHSDNKDEFNLEYEHLKKVGGIISFLVHNDIFFNKEYPQFIGKYQKLLRKLYEDNLICCLPEDIYNISKPFLS